jgi:hypothetical protein
VVDAAAKDHLVYRMTEGNSCYRGGKPGMSDAFASTLWAGDYMLDLATAGCAGVNLHGGSGSAVRASLGNHMPGELLIKNGQKVKGAFYTPIAGDLGDGFVARPIFYGMYMANQLAGLKSRPVNLTTSGVNATAYAGEKDGELRIALFNKDDAKDLKLNLRAPAGMAKAKVWRLTAPALDSTSGVTLAAAEITPAATWSPAKIETPAIADGTVTLDLPHASAALVFLER